MTPVTARDWLALVLIAALGIAALAWLLPLSARYPFVMPPDMYDRFTPVKKPFAGLMEVAPVAAGIAVVTTCALLYGSWMNWSLSHPLWKRDPRRGDRR